MTAQWAPMDDEQGDLLSMIADPEQPVGRDLPDLFLDACRRDAMANHGLVSVNRVRELMAEHVDGAHHRYSAMWAHFTGKDRPMRRATDADGAHRWEPCSGSPSGNNARPYPVRVWVGTT